MWRNRFPFKTHVDSNTSVLLGMIMLLCNNLKQPHMGNSNKIVKLKSVSVQVGLEPTHWMNTQVELTTQNPTDRKHLLCKMSHTTSSVYQNSVSTLTVPLECMQMDNYPNQVTYKEYNLKLQQTMEKKKQLKQKGKKK